MIKYILLAFFICFIVYILGRKAGRAAGRAEVYEKMTIALLKIISANGGHEELLKLLERGVDDADEGDVVSSSERGGREAP